MAAPRVSEVAAQPMFKVVAVVLKRSKEVEPVVSDVVNAGEVSKTATPVPVSSVRALARLADDGVERKVLTPVAGTVTESAPVPPEVVTKPFVVRFESVEIFCEALTVIVLVERVNPVENVSGTS